jgi:hypothetical protein
MKYTMKPLAPGDSKTPNRLMSGEMTCAICRERIRRSDERARLDETFTFLVDARPVHCRCLRNDVLEMPKRKGHARLAASANRILTKAREKRTTR